MSDEQRAKEFERIEENLLRIKQIIDEPRDKKDDALIKLGKILARTEFALESVERLKDEA